MTNFINSFGYSLEPVHTGMIVYLCDLWNEGKKEPLRAFLDHLRIPFGKHYKLRTAREHKNIDLVIFDAENDYPIVSVEMKVDSHEGWVKGEHQTVFYPTLLPEGTPFLYVTLGVGEYYHAPYGKQAQWVRIREFHGALEAISDDDPLICGWREAIANEIDLQDRCFSGDMSRIDEYRGRTWSLYLLGHLKERLITSLPDLTDAGIDPTMYAHPPGPDAILNFGESKHPTYMEINNNGLLNLKTNLEGLATSEQKEACFESTRVHYQALLEEFKPSLNMRRLNPTAKSKTIMSFDVGLNSRNGNLRYASTEAETLRTLAEVLLKFYRTPDPALPC